MRHGRSGQRRAAAHGIGRKGAGLAAGSLLLVGTLTAVVGTPSAGAATPAVGLTAPTANGHLYRHGAVPRIVSGSAGTAAPSQSAAPSPSAVSNGPASAALASGQDVTYGGGLTTGGLLGAGVTTGQPKLYLVFVGGQWGTESTNGSGQAVFSNDHDAEAPALQSFYGGLGSDRELWSGIVTQYCDGVAVGSTSCNTASQNIPYPSPGVLAGTWYDNSASATSVTAAGATGNQLAAEAEAAATHFGNLTQASNRDTQYVIASPTGANPDGWNDPKTGYCAYHDDTHDPYIDGGGPVSGPIVAFTNLPYIPDAGASCGGNFVNSGAAGVLDGATSTASHEYAETLTDQFPETTPVPGWSNAAGNEIADLCDYIAAPNPGAEYDLTLATGTFAVQGLWSNEANGGKGGCVEGAPNATFAPTITGFSPLVAPAGAWVTITGTALNGATHVAFDGVAASIVNDTPGALVAAVPSAVTVGPITVTTAGGAAVSHRSFLPKPTVTGFSPSSGARGSLVIINGSGLAGARKVSLHGKRMTVVADGPTKVTAIVPARGVSGPVAVKTKGGLSTSATNFTVT
jgi:IPT/TIG domain